MMRTIINNNVVQFFIKNHKLNALKLLLAMIFSGFFQVSIMGFLLPVLEFMQGQGAIDKENLLVYYL